MCTLLPVKCLLPDLKYFHPIAVTFKQYLTFFIKCTANKCINTCINNTDKNSWS